MLQRLMVRLSIFIFFLIKIIKIKNLTQESNHPNGDVQLHLCNRLSRFQRKGKRDGLREFYHKRIVRMKNRSRSCLRSISCDEWRFEIFSMLNGYCHQSNNLNKIFRVRLSLLGPIKRSKFLTVSGRITLVSTTRTSALDATDTTMATAHWRDKSMSCVNQTNKDFCKLLAPSKYKCGQSVIGIDVILLKVINYYSIIMLQITLSAFTHSTQATSNCGEAPKLNTWHGGGGGVLLLIRRLSIDGQNCTSRSALDGPVSVKL